MPRFSTEALDAVVAHGLRLHAAVERGERLSLKHEQARLTSLVLEAPADDEGGNPLGARYAVVCWLDELFTCHSRWSDVWNESKLESSLYGGNDRASEFWRQAKLAEAQSTDDILAVYFLCVALGFRGKLRNNPQELQDWVEQTRLRLTRKWPGQPPAALPAMRRRSNRALHGAARVRCMTAVAAVVITCLLPVATFTLVQRLVG